MIKTNKDGIVCEHLLTDDRGVAYSSDYKYLICGNDNLREYSVRDGVEVICDEAFFDGFLQRITLPKSLKVIGREAFAHCSKLDEVMLPSGLREIRDGAFYGCSSLKKVRLPMNAKLISETAFPMNVDIIMVD